MNQTCAVLFHFFMFFFFFFGHEYILHTTFVKIFVKCFIFLSNTNQTVHVPSFSIPQNITHIQHNASSVSACQYYHRIASCSCSIHIQANENICLFMNRKKCLQLCCLCATFLVEYCAATFSIMTDCSFIATQQAVFLQWLWPPHKHVCRFYGKNLPNHDSKKPLIIP